jgi:hypothetical protein
MIVLAAWFTLLGGCASGPSSADGPDITGGLSLRMMIARPGDSFALYEVRTDGTLLYGGGRDALNDHFTWTGPLTAEEIAELNRLVDEHGWFERDIASESDAEGIKTMITVRRAGAKRAFTVRGVSPRVEPVEALMRSAAQRRHDEFIRTLPQPGQRR